MASDFLREAAVLVFVFNLLEPGIKTARAPEADTGLLALGTTFLFWTFGAIVEWTRVPQ